MNAFGIARSGLEASLVRLAASTSNIANAQSVGPVPGGAPGSAADDGAEGGRRACQPVHVEISPLAGGGVQARLVRLSPDL